MKFCHQFLLLCKILLFCRELQPDFFLCIVKRNDAFADNFTILLVLYRCMSDNKNLRVFIQKATVSLIVLREYDNLYISGQILHRNECHRLIISGKFHSLCRDDSTNDHMRIILHFDSPSLFLTDEIECICGDTFFHFVHVLFQRMSTKVNAEHFFFKAQKHLFVELTCIRILYFVILFIFLGYQVKQAHLPGHRIFLLMYHLIHDRRVDHGHLLSRSVETVTRPRLDQIFNGTLIDIPLRGTLNEILQRAVRSSKLALFDNFVNDRTTQSFDRIKTVADIFPFCREFTASHIDIRRQYLDSHILAVEQILCRFCRVVNDRCHKSCHKFYRIIMF